MNNGGCDQLCHNRPGTFMCEVINDPFLYIQQIKKIFLSNFLHSVPQASVVQSHVLTSMSACSTMVMVHVKILAPTLMEDTRYALT